MSVDAETPGILQPGQIIRPQVSIKTAKTLAENLYGIKVLSIKELNSYDDKNYRITVSEEVTNPHITQVWPHGYILKILNSLDSQKKHVDAQHAMQKHLSEHGVQCPVPALNLHGKDYSLEQLKTEQENTSGEWTENNECVPNTSCHLVRLLTFLPGKILFQVPYTAQIITESGELLGQISKALQDFDHPVLASHQTLWSLKSFPELVNFLHAVTDPDDLKLVQEVIKAFKEEVEPNYPNFRESCIHGDYNEQNILVGARTEVGSGDGDYTICGVIDFGDVHKAYTVMEVALGIVYHTIAGTILDIYEVGGYFLRGYFRHMQLTEAEQNALYVLICARYCQSIVMGAYTNMLDPSNTYVLTTQKDGWEQLRRLWNNPRNQLYDTWKTILQAEKA